MLEMTPIQRLWIISQSLEMFPMTPILLIFSNKIIIVANNGNKVVIMAIRV